MSCTLSGRGLANQPVAFSCPVQLGPRDTRLGAEPWSRLLQCARLATRRRQGLPRTSSKRGPGSARLLTRGARALGASLSLQQGDKSAAGALEKLFVSGLKPFSGAPPGTRVELQGPLWGFSLTLVASRHQQSAVWGCSGHPLPSAPVLEILA